jgi:hypothetical protein
MMKVYEFPAQITSEGTLQLPHSIRSSLSNQQTVKVILLVAESDNTTEEDWNRLATEQFLAGYAEVDAIYDKI